ncbi:MAG TPA: hypothetical protein VJ856_05510 [Paludibacteraceae bacterium]|nr:hypothetical protein [Paludibacteraceae bacterium]
MKRLDNFWGALGVGFIMPLFFGWLFLASFYKGDLSLMDFFQVIKTSSSAIVSKLILVALVPNLFAVFACYAKELWKACRGFFVPVLFYLAAAMFFI